MHDARGHLKEAQRIVVKLGTQVVTHDGIHFALGRLMGLVEELAQLRRSGRQVVLVTSGAVGLGMRALGLAVRPRSLGLRQACAAVGQSELMAIYAQAFSKLGVTVAQVLLTQEDLADRDRALCVTTTLRRLLELGVLPVLNENDSVSVRELTEYRRASGAEPPGAPPVFGDNDGLAARVAASVDADLLVLVTNVDGVFTANPAHDRLARRIPVLGGIGDEILARAVDSSALGTGGMESKLRAAAWAVGEGTTVVIANGETPHLLGRVLAGEDLGTIVVPAERRRARLRHIAVSGEAKGALVVNDGAAEALVARKASLLPIGLVRVEGHFGKGDLVEVRDGSGRILGRGLVNYDAASCRTLAGHPSDEIELLLGHRGYDEVVTRDNLVVVAS